MTDDAHVGRRTVLKYAGSAFALGLAPQASAAETSRYIAVTNGGSPAVSRSDFTARHALADGDVLIAEGPADATDELAALSDVSDATADATVPVARSPVDTASETTDEPGFEAQWDKRRIEAPAAHERTTGEGTSIAVIDSGIAADHPDLAPNVDGESSRLVKNAELLSDEDPVDPVGHGTHVAGIAAASAANDAGVVGTAPDADLVSLRLAYENDAGELVEDFSGALLALAYVAQIGVDVANLSLQSDAFPPKFNGSAYRRAYHRLVQYAIDQGTAVVAAAGNKELDLQHGGQTIVPGDLPPAITVSATGPNDEMAYYSNYGRGFVDVAAPGGGYETEPKTESTDGVDWPAPTNLVLSTMAPESRLGTDVGGAEYAYAAGTSQAAPQVSGALALLRSEYPDASHYTLANAIAQGADGPHGRSHPEFGAGHLNVPAAFDANVLNGRRPK